MGRISRWKPCANFRVGARQDAKRERGPHFAHILRRFCSKNCAEWRHIVCRGGRFEFGARPRWFSLLGIVPLACASLCLGACTNYTASEIPINPVILLGPAPSGTSATTGISAIQRNAAGGVVMTVGAHNVEPTFKGYRIFQGATESDVVNQADSAGTDCGAFINFPVSSVSYTLEASTTPSLTSSYLLCVFPLDLTAGNYVAIRSRSFAGLGQPDRLSLSSNALLVP